MFKSVLSLLLLVFIVAFTSPLYGATEPTPHVDSKSESDSTNIKNKHLVTVDKENQLKVSQSSQETKGQFWESSQEVEEDSTSNSALSFNFIYYIIEKFKFQVE